MRIPGWADTAMDWVTRHRWLTATSTTVVAAFIAVFWLPAFAGLLLGLLAGICVGLGAGEDKRAALVAENKRADFRIGQLLRETALLGARPAADATTKAIAYIPDSDERQSR